MSHILVAPLGGGIQPRLEINTFVRNDMHFSLYVQALNQMQAVGQSDFSSFFQVGGIHGLPFTPYDGASVAGFTPNPNNQWAGYCTHGSVLFPTWHRPYVMLIEQIINANAQQIAGTYTTNRAAWQAAAVNLRQPYWDWASNMVPPDEVIALDQVEITAPNGQRANVTNPLRRYRFHPIDPSFPSPYSNWPTTLRQPDDNSPGATDDVAQLRSVLQNSQRSTTQDTYSMLTQIRTWPRFASHTLNKGGSANSLESIHDNIHVLVGGNGQMSDPSVAGFDPIFFLHHANVDRMVSLWSALNPGVWMTAGDAQDGTWTLRRNQRVDPTTDLTPFWRTQTTFWKSNQLSSTGQLGYTYPEFVGQSTNPTTLRSAIASRVRQLYGPQSPPMSRRSIEGGVATTVDDNVHHSSWGRRQHEVTNRGLIDGLLRGKYSEWTARVLFRRSDVGHSFSVIFFMGDVPANPKQWLTATNFVGAHHAFIHSSQCTECDKDDPLEEGFVSLTPYITKRTSLTSLVSSLVAPLLTQQLQWRVLRTDGQVIDQVPSLDVTILETPLDFVGSDLPVIGQIKSWDNVTRGRPGGASGKFSV